MLVAAWTSGSREKNSAHNTPAESKQNVSAGGSTVRAPQTSRQTCTRHRAHAPQAAVSLAPCSRKVSSGCLPLA